MARSNTASADRLSFRGLLHEAPVTSQMSDAMPATAQRRGPIHRSKIASMLPAVFGLIGVIVGGLLNAAVTGWQARRDDVASGRVAARLVDLELRGEAGES